MAMAWLIIPRIKKGPSLHAGAHKQQSVTKERGTKEFRLSHGEGVKTGSPRGRHQGNNYFRQGSGLMLN